MVFKFMIWCEYSGVTKTADLYFAFAAVREIKTPLMRIFMPTICRLFLVELLKFARLFGRGQIFD